MSAILRPVRSYANNISSILDNDPKLVQLKCKGTLCELGQGFEPWVLRKACQGFPLHTL